jgi:hypothetical protein
MTVGGRRVVLCPPELAFGAQAAAAPYAIVPPNSAVRYEVELLRLSRRGPDALFKVSSESRARTRVCVCVCVCMWSAGFNKVSVYGPASFKGRLVCRVACT